MATFDFLSPENVEDEDNLSDGENEENQGDDDERIPNMVKRPKTTKVSPFPGPYKLADTCS